MRTQYTLTLEKAADFWILAFVADCVQIMNYTPYELYMRVGDTVPQAGPLAWHHRVPPGLMATIPANSRYFSATLDSPPPAKLNPGLDNVDADASRVDLIFMAGETPQAMTQLNSPSQYGLAWK